MNTDATSATSNSLNISRVNFVDVTSYLKLVQLIMNLKP